MEERDFYLGFSVFPGVGAGRFSLLLDHFGSAKAAWNASISDLLPILKEKITEDFLTFRDTFDISSYKTVLLKKGISYITFEDEAYPKQLKDLDKPPFILYVKGDKEIFKGFPADKKIGIVGTRKVTSYGRQITKQFTKELVEAGFITISGLALGVDAIAHSSTIESGGKTIAVLGCGVDCCYPSTNQGLYRQILETGGAIISEYPLSVPPNQGSFPSRNRIIAALSDGLLVTEGAEDSGSLITAKVALSLNRPVFAIPGPVTSSLSRGPLRLIRKGARLVTSGEEILEELGIKNQELRNGKKIIKTDTPEEQTVIDCLMDENLSFDEIVKKTHISASNLGTLLSLMEMKQLISLSHTGVYHLAT